MSPEAQLPINPEELVAAAVDGDWALVDRVIGSVADNDDFLRMARDHIGDEKENLRDLAMTIYEASSRGISSQFGQRLFEVMETDESFFVQFRAACALFKNANRRDREVLAKIRQGLDEEDTALVARHYLEQYEEE